MFYHGFENYIKYAYPEDELRPLSCRPLSRDRENPAHAELNDVLGNYSLTLIDSLSSLAILSSADGGGRALGHFQDGIKDFVRLYGDGSSGPAGQGERARGFDIDSKVQVFETVIRGLGRVLSSQLWMQLLLTVAVARGPTQRPPFRSGRSPNYRIQPSGDRGCVCQSMGQDVLP